MRYVWRVQNKSGAGPYNTDTNKIWYWRNGAATVDRPNPHDDAFGYIQRQRIEALFDARKGSCGFDTKRKAMAWFSDDALAELEGLGFHLVKVKAKTIIRNKDAKQCIFISDKRKKRSKK